MLHAKNLPYHFQDEAINTACHIHYRVTIQPGTKVTHYELWRGRKPSVRYFHFFGSKCYILFDREQRHNLDPKSYQRIFSGYSINSRAYHVFYNRTNSMMESINVIFYDTQYKDIG